MNEVVRVVRGARALTRSYTSWKTRRYRPRSDAPVRQCREGRKSRDAEVAAPAKTAEPRETPALHPRHRGAGCPRNGRVVAFATCCLRGRPGSHARGSQVVLASVGTSVPGSGEPSRGARALVPTPAQAVSSQRKTRPERARCREEKQNERRTDSADRDRFRRSGRVVEGTGFENRRSRKATVGSNPSSSAKQTGKDERARHAAHAASQTRSRKSTVTSA
jgi:hypothetical protein